MAYYHGTTAVLAPGTKLLTPAGGGQRSMGAWYGAANVQDEVEIEGLGTVPRTTLVWLTEDVDEAAEWVEKALLKWSPTDFDAAWRQGERAVRVYEVRPDAPIHSPTDPHSPTERATMAATVGDVAYEGEPFGAPCECGGVRLDPDAARCDLCQERA